MDVRCPQCDTLYEIDARQLRGGAATFKCSQCENVFRLETHAALSQENQRRWMVRDATSGDIRYFATFDQLHQWIMDGSVDKTDEVSRTGKKWKALASIGEFMPIFQAVESISSISSSRAAQKRTPSQANDEASSPQVAPQTTDREPAGDDASAGDVSPGQPAGRAQPAASSRQPDEPFRSKVKTSPQFVVDKPDSPASPDLSEASGPQISHTPLEGQRSQTPAPHTLDPQGGEASSQPQVNLQSGTFAGVDSGDDDWSFGDDATLGDAQSTDSFDEVDYESRGRWPKVLLVVALLVAAGGTGLYLARPDLVDEFIERATGSQPETIAQPADDQEDDGNQEAGELGEAVATATRAAVDAAEQANARHLGELVAVAGPSLEAAVERAAELADEAGKEAQKPDADKILARARRDLERGRNERARDRFHRVLELERNNAAAITGLGWSLLALGRPSAASAQFRKALSVNPSYGDAYIGLGRAERDQGNQPAALKAYRDYLSRFPGGPKASIADYQAKQLEAALE